MNKVFKFYYDKEKQDFSIYTYEDLIQSIKLQFVAVIKKCNIDNELRADYFLTYKYYAKRYVGMYSQNIEINDKIESLYINTLRTLDINNKLPENRKYVPKKYNDPHMSINEKLEKKFLIEPNLWNRLDDYSRFVIDKYPEDPDYEYLSSWLYYQQNFIYVFIKEIMFCWGDGLELPKKINPIIPYLTDFKLK